MLKQVYESSLVKQFLAKIVQLPNLYEYADEFQSLNVMYMPEGESVLRTIIAGMYVMRRSIDQCDFMVCT